MPHSAVYIWYARSFRARQTEELQDFRSQVAARNFAVTDALEKQETEISELQFFDSPPK